MQVFESGSGKWLKIVDGRIFYTSDQSTATSFEDRDLRFAAQAFEDFVIYRKTLFAVPKGANSFPWECSTVSSYLEDVKKKDQYYDHD